MVSDSIINAFSNKIGAINITSGELIVNLVVAILLIITGILLGKIVKFALRKILDKIHLSKLIQKSFINLFLTVIKWSIYVLFIDFALLQLGIPAFTNWLTTILGVIPALTGALIIISVGFAISSYLKRTISESRIKGWETLSQIFFYFVLYVFIILALKTALISVKDTLLTNSLIVIFTLIAGIALLIQISQEKKA